MCDLLREYRNRPYPRITEIGELAPEHEFAVTWHFTPLENCVSRDRSPAQLNSWIYTQNKPLSVSRAESRTAARNATNCANEGGYSRRVCDRRPGFQTSLRAPRVRKGQPRPNSPLFWDLMVSRPEMWTAARTAANCADEAADSQGFCGCGAGS